MAERQERVRRAREAQAKAAREAETQSQEEDMGGAGGGMGGMGGLGGLLNDPELMAAFSDPEVAAAFKDISSNPTNILRYQTKVMAVFTKLVVVMVELKKPSWFMKIESRAREILLWRK